MNTIRKCFCLASASLLLAACATTGDPPVSKQPSATKYDAEYMANVEYVSGQAGVEVLWINPPRDQGDDED